MHGIDAVGVELLPNCHLAWEAKANVFAYDLEELEWIRTELRGISPPVADVPFPHLTITESAFPPENERDIVDYALWFEALPVSQASKTLCRAVLMSILEDVSYTRKDGQYLRWDVRAEKLIRRHRAKDTAGGASIRGIDKGELPTVKQSLVRKLDAIIRDIHELQQQPPSPSRQQEHHNLAKALTHHKFATSLMSYKDHLNSASDLATTYEETRAGFIQQALEKNDQATPYVAEAKALKLFAARLAHPRELLNFPEIKPILLTAAGVSAKALSYLKADDQTTAILGLIEKFLELAGDDHVDELVFRFLLTCGDALGGKMRNIGGVLAARKLSRTLIATLAVQSKPFAWLDATISSWLPGEPSTPNLELSMRGLHWQTGSQPRTLIYNVSVPIVRKNVDLCLFEALPADFVFRSKGPSPSHLRTSGSSCGSATGAKPLQIAPGPKAIVVTHRANAPAGRPHPTTPLAVVDSRNRAGRPG
jgi:hypothetical protein